MRNLIAVLALFAGALFLCGVAKAEIYGSVIYVPGESGEIYTSGPSSIVAAARRDIGTNPTGNRYLWCQDAVNIWLKEAGYSSTGSRASRSILSHGTRVQRANLRPGDIVYRPRRRGGHVEVFVRWANPEKTSYIAISGNSCGRRGRRHVCQLTRPASRIYRAIRVTDRT